MDIQDDIAPHVLERLRTGDPDAFDVIYEAYRARLYGFLLRLSQRRDVAEDLLQETWLRLATKASALRDDTRLAAWLFTVARNLFLSYRRNRSMDESRTGDLFRTQCFDQQHETPWASAAAGDMHAGIEEALANLPLPYREVLLMMAEGLTAAEAGAACDLTNAALRKRLSRARQLFEKRLSEAGIYGIRRRRRESA